MRRAQLVAMLDAVTKATRYHRRADEIRKIAEGIYDRQERALLLEVAKEYEQIAGDAERQ